MYAMIGRATVRFAVAFVRRRYGRQLKVGAGIAAVAIGIAAYLATREVREG